MVSLFPVMGLVSIAPAHANIPITEFVPNFGSSISDAAVAGAALTLGASTSFQGTAGSTHLGAASASNQFADGFAVKLSLDALSAPVALEPGLSGQTIAPGVYFSGAALTMNTDMNFDAHGDTGAVFVIRTPGAMTVAASAKMHLLGGAQAANVYWSIGGAVAVGANTALLGHFYTDTVITLGESTMVSGQLFAKAAIGLGANASVTNDLAIARPTLSWLNNSIPAATLGHTYLTNLTAAKTLTPASPETSVAFTIDSGVLPDGLHLDGTTGIISGNPTTVGTSNFGIDAHLFGYTVLSSTFAMTVSATPVPTATPTPPAPTPPASPTTPVSPAVPTATPGAPATVNRTTPPIPFATSGNGASGAQVIGTVPGSSTSTEVDRNGVAVVTHADLTVASIKLLATSYFRVLNSEEFALIKPQAIPGLLPNQIRAMSPTTLSKMSPSQFNLLSKLQISALSGAQLNAMSSETLDTASRKQLQALSKTAGSGLTTKSISELNSKAILGIPQAIYRAMTPTQQQAMRSAGAKKLSSTQQPTPVKPKSCALSGIQAFNPAKSKSTAKAQQRPSLNCRKYLEA